MAETTSGGQGGEAVKPRWWLGTVTHDEPARTDAVLWGPVGKGDYREFTPGRNGQYTLGQYVSDLRPATVVADRDYDAFDHATRVVSGIDGRWSWMCNTCGATEGGYGSREDAESDADEPELHNEFRRAPQPTPAREAPTDDAARGAPTSPADADSGVSARPLDALTGGNPRPGGGPPLRSAGEAPPTDDAALVEEVARWLADFADDDPWERIPAVTQNAYRDTARNDLLNLPGLRAVAGRAQREALLAQAASTLLDQYDRLVETLDHVVMDTPADRDLHDQLVATYRGYSQVLRHLTAPATDDTEGQR